MSHHEDADAASETAQPTHTVVRPPVEDELRALNDMLKTLTHVQSSFIAHGNPRDSFNELLTEVLRLTESEYGFIGEILRDEQGHPYLKTQAITNIAWSEETRAIYDREAVEGVEFRNLKSLFGAVMTTGDAVIANAPATDTRRGGLPPGHPPLNAFLGLPFRRSDRLIGMIGLANRPGGYDLKLVERLEPFLVTCAALTEAFRSERGRREAALALESARARLSAALSVGGIGLWTLHPAEGRVEWHDSALQLFGKSLPEMALPAQQELCDLAHPEDRQRLRAALEATVIHGADIDIEFRAVRPDGRMLWLAAKGKMERDGEGRPLRMANAAVDITERKLLEEQLRQSQKMEAIGQLAGGVAHDFNNLLTVIEMHASLIKSEPTVSGDMKESIAAIVEATRSAGNLTRQLLTFSRRQPVRLSAVDVNEVVLRVGTMLRRTLSEKVSVVIRRAPLLPMVQADPGMLEQVLLNLAVNARDAMPSGGQLTIETSLAKMAAPSDAAASFDRLRPSGTCVCLTVSDTGVGIPPEHMERVFEPFFTTKDVGKGSGLGLATVYGIVKQHNGWITLRSDKGHGTTFEILLRVLPQARERPPVERPAATVGGGAETILVVEDQDRLRQLVCTTLRQYGYNVLAAASGHEAFGVWEAHAGRIDLLLTDMVMPGGVSGRDVAERLRAEKPSLRVIFTSGYVADNAMAPDDVFLQKPFEAAALVRLVRRCLDAT